MLVKSNRHVNPTRKVPKSLEAFAFESHKEAIFFCLVAVCFAASLIYYTALHYCSNLVFCVCSGSLSASSGGAPCANYLVVCLFRQDKNKTLPMAAVVVVARRHVWHTAYICTPKKRKTWPKKSNSNENVWKNPSIINVWEQRINWRRSRRSKQKSRIY